MKSLEQASNEYLDRTEQQAEEREAESWEERIALWRKLAVRLTNVPWKEEGALRFSIKDSDFGKETTIEVVYDSGREDDNLRNYLGTMSGPDFVTDRPRADCFRRITDMKIENEKYVFSLADTMPQGWSIYSFVEDTAKLEEEPHAYAAVTITGRKYNIIFVYSDITSPLGLESLLHEIHHAQTQDLSVGSDNRRQARNRKESRLGVIDKAEIITDERNADAFSLSILHRLFGKSIDIDGIKKVMYSSQGNYHKSYGIKK